MGDAMIISVERNYRKIRMHIKRELMKHGLGLLSRVPAKLLLLPETEGRWMSVCQRYMVHRRNYTIGKEMLLALTTLHQPIHHIVQQMKPEDLKELGTIGNLGAVARRIINEWKKQGKPKGGPAQVGETFIVLIKTTSDVAAWI